MSEVRPPGPVADARQPSAEPWVVRHRMLVLLVLSAVVFVGFRDEVIARAPARVGSAAVQDAADDTGRADVGPVEKGADHRGGRRLSMCAPDGHRVRFQPD